MVRKITSFYEKLEKKMSDLVRDLILIFPVFPESTDMGKKKNSMKKFQDRAHLTKSLSLFQLLLENTFLQSFSNLFIERTLNFVEKGKSLPPSQFLPYVLVLYLLNPFCRSIHDVHISKA